LRYTQGGKRRWERLDASSYKEAHAAWLKKQYELITEECSDKPTLSQHIQKTFNVQPSRPKPEPKPVAKPGELMLDAAIDKYLENVATKSSKTSSGYRYTLQQFYASTGNSLLSSVTTQQLYASSGTYGGRVSETAPSITASVRSLHSCATSGSRM
jgi:hypothetical protein